jgi:hypothetical protein
LTPAFLQQELLMPNLYALALMLVHRNKVRPANVLARSIPTAYSCRPWHTNAAQAAHRLHNATHPTPTA